MYQETWLESQLRRLDEWLKDHVPTECFNCHKWFWRKDTQPERHCVLGWVRMCKPCRTKLHSWQREDEC